MVFETGIIKGKKTRYYKQSEGKEIIRYSKTINLGVNSSFNIDDSVVVLSDDDFKNLNNNNASERISELNCIIADNENIINVLSDEVAALRAEVKKLTNSNNKYLETINRLTSDNKADELELTELKRVMKHHDITSADELQQLFKLFELLEVDYIRTIDYLNKYLDMLQQRGLLQRIINKDVVVDSPALKYIDVKGNKLPSADVIPVSKSD